MPETISLRQLNRTLLSRQMLLRRHDLAPHPAIETLIGLQSQIPNPPYIGLWTRLGQFQRSELTTLLEERKVVRAAWIRSTLHLVSAADHQRFQAVIQPALARGLRSFFGKRAKELDIQRLIAIAKPFLDAEEPAIGELRKHLQAHEPELNKEAMAYAVRSHLPLVQVPPGGAWGVGTRATYTTAERWLGAPTPSDLPSLFRRYLAAYGPASVMDFQTWAGMTSLKAKLAATVADLPEYRDHNGKAIYDLPGKPLVAADAPAPIRYLPEYDNILIAHQSRARILPDEHRKKVFLTAGRVASAVLVDGFVAGVWKTTRDKTSTSLHVRLFEAQPKAKMAALEEEGDKLLRFIEDDADQFRVEFERHS